MTLMVVSPQPAPKNESWMESAVSGGVPFTISEHVYFKEDGCVYFKEEGAF